MDKNQATGLVLMAILLLVYFIFFGNQQVEQPLGSPVRFYRLSARCRAAIY
jgi:hypothetical protein